MARLANRRTRSPVSEDEEESRPQTPLSTAPNDRKRARRQVEESESSASEESEDEPAPAQRDVVDRKPTLSNGNITTGHKPGAIVRIKLKNFVTYTSVEFYPGPSLNMIIGPNGTGKSTFVCAICLGLGWAPTYLGRAKDPAEFVKHGSREATIEIELQRKTAGAGMTRANPIITRIIKRDGNKSKFMINGSESSQKGVQSLCRSTFDIQIDNLCQFLPQDKVVEFAMMSPTEVLASTQRAAGTPEMIKNQDHLKRLRAAQKDLMQSNRGDRELLENLQRRQETLRAEVDRMLEREATKKKLGWLELAKPVPEYGDAQQQKKEARQLQQRLNEELTQLRAEVAPTLRKVNAKQDHRLRMQNLQKDMKRDVAKAEATYNTKLREYTAMGAKLNDLQQNYDAEAESRRKRRERKLQHQNSIAQLEQQHRQRPADFDSRAMNQDIRDRRDEARQLNDQKSELETRRAELREQGISRQREAGILNSRLASLETQAGQQENRLAAASKDTYEAWTWIQTHQNLFEKPVYGPPLVECSLKDPKLAGQVEAAMQKSDFKIITAQTSADFKLLQQKLNVEMGKADITLRTCSETDLSRYRKPIPDDELASYGIDGYIIDQLEGPAPVLAMLCTERFLHQSGIASNPVNDQQHNAMQDSELKSYVTRETSYRFVRRSEYGKEGNMSSSKPLGVPQFWTAQSVDMGRRAAIQREVNEKAGELAIIQEEHQTCQKQIIAVNEQVKKLEGEIKHIETERGAKQRELMTWNGLPLKIQEEKTAITQIDDFLDSIASRRDGILKQKDKILLEQASMAVDVEEALAVYKDEMSDLLRAEYYLIEAISDYESFEERNKHVKERIDELKKDERAARAKSEEVSKRAIDLYKKVKQLSQQAQTLAEDGESGFLEILQAMSGTAGEERWSANRLAAEIDSQTALLELTEGGSTDSIKAFEDRAKQIEELQKKLTDLDQQQQGHANAIKEVRQQWEAPLEALTAKISESFSDSFARIGCAGQVEVYKASSEDAADCTEENGGVENGLDFANWAIHISVKFRENEPLSLLDSRRQSGGERAVSTIFYLMALQSLSRAPFRVVDEINQGMDPRNERMVHGRMVDVATGTGGSQYFLITPKLLTGLKYKRGMTVLCIVSGENVPGDNEKYQGGDDMVEMPVPKMDFMAFARKARELNIASSAGGRRVDSGVGFEGSFGSTGSVEVGA